MINAFLDTCSGICWSIVYIAAIVLGNKHKTWLIPAASICLNLSWEFWIVVFHFFHGSAVGRTFWIQLAWLLLDIGVFITLICNCPKTKMVIFGLTAALILGWLLLFRLGLWAEFAFVDNVLMSFLFIRRWQRDNQKGNSRLIGEMKLLGTLSATLLEGILYRNLFALYVGGICLIFDAYYLLLVNQKTERYSKNQCD